MQKRDPAGDFVFPNSKLLFSLNCFYVIHSLPLVIVKVQFYSGIRFFSGEAGCNSLHIENCGSSILNKLIFLGLSGQSGFPGNVEPACLI